jgi:hypothetical protein
MQHIGNQSSADVHQSLLLSDEKVRLPEPSYTLLDSYNISDAPPRPNAYIRYVMLHWPSDWHWVLLSREHGLSLLRLIFLNIFYYYVWTMVYRTWGFHKCISGVLNFSFVLQFYPWNGFSMSLRCWPCSQAAEEVVRVHGMFLAEKWLINVAPSIRRSWH